MAGRAPKPPPGLQVVPTFDEAQRQELVRLGLSGEQIEAVERVLPRCRSELRKLPATNDVRAVVQKLEKSLGSAAAALSDVLSAHDDDQPGADQGAAFVAGLLSAAEDEALTATLQQLLRAQRIVSGAKLASGRELAGLKQRMPSGQRLKNEGSPAPAMWIHEAIGTSSRKFKKSSEAFASVVAICYAAIGSSSATTGLQNYRDLRVKPGK